MKNGVHHRNNWRVTMFLFAITGLVESLAFGHLGAFTPIYLQQLHVPLHAIPFWTGLLSSVGFIIGMPLLPFWGVWADRYGRKLIIMRSAIIEAFIFAFAAQCTNVYMLTLARFLSGFILGNTGIMMAVQTEITPRDRIGATISIVSAGSPVGMAIGPYLGGLIVKAVGIRVLLMLDAGLTVLVVGLLAVVLREEPRHNATNSSVREGVVAALRTMRTTHGVSTLLGAVFLVMFGQSMAMPYLPIIIQSIYRGSSLAPTIGAVLTVSGIAMAIATPCWGPIGDRLGHMRVLRACALVVAVTMLGQVLAHGVFGIGAWRAAQGLCQGGLGALATVLLALHSPPERRSSILTMSLLPNQFAWFIGPLAGAQLSAISIALPFWGGAIAVLAGIMMSYGVPAHYHASPD